MSGYETLTPNFFSADLTDGKIELHPPYGFSCFFIVEHTDQPEFIKKHATELLLAGCRSFCFFGSRSAEWERGVVEAEKALFPTKAPEDAAQIKTIDSIEDFISDMRDNLMIRYLVPYYFYLLHDDDTLYGKVVRGLEIKN